MPTCFVIGNEPITKQCIAGFIEKQSGWKIVSQAVNLRQAAGAIAQCQPDVCFVDLNLDGRSEIEAAREMAANFACLWVFISSHRQFAATAYEIVAVDYVLKPFTLSRLQNVVQKLETRLSASCTENQQNLPVASIDDIKMLEVDDIFWINTSGDFLELHCQKKMWLCRDTLVKLVSQLDPKKFLRVHGNTLVNIKKVSSLSEELGEFSWLHLANGDKLKIDQQHRSPLFECLGL